MNAAILAVVTHSTGIGGVAVEAFALEPDSIIHRIGFEQGKTGEILNGNRAQIAAVIRCLEAALEDAERLADIPEVRGG